MILVLLGTQKYNFNRLLDCIQENIDNGTIKDKVIVQAGHTKFKSKDMEIFDLIPIDKMSELMDEADIVITHGGVGSIVGALKKQKKIIAMPRLKKYGEVANDHQKETVEMFLKNNYIKCANTAEELSNVLKKINDFIPSTYISNTNKIIKIVEEYIENN